jgi:hypothetical protein
MPGLAPPPRPSLPPLLSIAMHLPLVVSLLLTTALLAQRVPETEIVNDTFPGELIAAGTQIDATLTAGDQDWFQFTTPGGQVRITTSNPALAADTRITLFTVPGNVAIAINDDSRPNFASDITINLAAGSYAVQVVGFTALTTGPYSLDLGLAAPPKPYTGSEVEPNDVVSAAGVFTLVDGAQIQGSLASGTDVDVYRVVLTAPRSGVWFQVTEGDAPWVSGHRYEILDATGALLAPTGTFGSNAGDSNSFTYRTSQIRCWPAGTYHLVVRNRSVAATFNPVPTGSYRLEFVALPMLTGGQVIEAPVLDANGQLATPIAPGQEGIGTLSVGLEADRWGPLVIGQPLVLQFQTAPGAAPAVLDTTIGVRPFDPITGTLGPSTDVLVGNLLDPTSHARGTFSFLLAPSTYYLEVRSPGPAASQLGNYRLQISAASQVPYVTASYGLFAANATCGQAPFPTLTRQFSNEAPTIGQTFSRQLTGLQPFGLGLLIQGTAQTAPFDLTPFGAAGCTLDVSALAVTVHLGDAAGTAEMSLNVPPVPSLRGTVLWEQAAEFDGQNGLGVQFGSFARLLVGERSY